MRTPVPIPRAPAPRSPQRVSVLKFLELVRWLDGSPILATIEPYRQKILSDVLDTWDGPRVRYTEALIGRAKKNAKSLDLVLAALFACCANPSVHGNEAFIVASDEDQAGDDLDLLKKLVRASPALGTRLVIQEKSVIRKDGRGHITILPGKDVAGSHGKTFRFMGVDEIHTQTTWALLEALALDPTRPDCQRWITSYASIHHRPGVPLFDMLAMAKRGDDPNFYLSWFAADWCSDPVAAALPTPEQRANPSLASFGPDYLAQQQRRVPAHVYRRLHLNLPGLPQGAAFSAETIMDAVTRGVRVRKPERGITFYAFVDMSGGSNDDATMGISYKDNDGRGVLACLMNQGQPAPFDPYAAVTRFASVLKEYGVTHVVGDRYAGQTFEVAFLKHNIAYEVCALPASKLYEALEPSLNAHEIILLDHPELESQLLSLTWRAGKIDHPPGEKDDLANAAAGALLLALDPVPEIDYSMTEEERWSIRRMQMRPGEIWGFPEDEVGGNLFDRF